MSRMPKSTELPIRRGVLIECNRAAKNELAFDPDILGERIGDIKNQKRRYEHMFGYALSTFLKSQDLQSGRARNGAGVGFKVVTELLAIAPHAFLRYCKEQDADPSLTVLNEALHASAETPLRLLNLPNGTNRQVELGLGLKGEFDAAKMTAEQGAFQFKSGENGLVFQLDDEQFAEFGGEPDYSANPWLPEHWQRCPARRLVTERIWPAMVDLATDTPSIFAQDLGIRDTI